MTMRTLAGLAFILGLAGPVSAQNAGAPAVKADLQAEHQQLMEWKKAKLDELKAEKEKLEAEAKPVREQIEKLRAEIEPLRKQIEELRAKMAPVKEKIEALKAQLEPFKGRRGELKSKHQALMKEFQEKMAALKAKRSEAQAAKPADKQPKKAEPKK